MTQLRFPNPGSDVERMVRIFCLIALATQGRDSFDLDDMTDTATTHAQASSQGAHGAMAVQRSRREDRSRDPLYNQLKMYSEVYRMLGWLRPLANQRRRFRVTLLGETVAFDTAGDRAYLRGLVQESLLGVVFPNTVTENIGVVSQRPFRWLLMLTEALGGVITRHEMILGLLAVVDDRQPGAMSSAVDRILQLRKGPISGLYSAVDDFAFEQRVQANTLENYTRLPVGVLASPFVGWGERTRVPHLYASPRAVPATRLLPKGHAAAKSVSERADVRSDELSSLSSTDRASFATFSFYALLARAGLPDSEIEQPLATAAQLAGTILQKLDIAWPTADFVYSPFTQEDESVLTLARSASE